MMITLFLFIENHYAPFRFSFGARDRLIPALSGKINAGDEGLTIPF